VHRPGLTISVHLGPRAALRPLFRLADDSSLAIDRSIELGVVQVCSIGGEVVGHAQIVQGQAAEEWELKSLAVEPSHRRQGIGGRLVQASLVYAREHGAKRMVVGTSTADLDNLRFYQRLGFRMVSIERDAFNAAAGYPEGLAVDGVPVRDRAWLDLVL
jgi:GNAT superfamily N-acetyltransferase